jgi:enoyl-CoA hydratase/carnithine racemase
MRRDRGFLCANEIQLGMIIPPPELALFRHKMPMPAFFDTVQLARRWSAPEALAAGIVQHIESQDMLLQAALQRAAALAPLGANRKVYRAQKESLYGENAAINTPHGPAYMLRHAAQYRH